MCGIVGIVGHRPVNQALYDGLTVLQHRGQDAAGIVTVADWQFRQRKAMGFVRDVFEPKHMYRLQGRIGIGHVRYPTSGGATAAEAQPIYVNSPFGITLAHNGNLTNAQALRIFLQNDARRHINTCSDSELLLNIFAHELEKLTPGSLMAESIFSAVSALHTRVKGAYAVTGVIIGYGLFAFRDPYGIRPLILGKRELDSGQTEYMVASESVALDAVGFSVIRDVAPGECIFVSEQGMLLTRQCAKNPCHNPCLFEFVYFARPDSFLDQVSVYAARVRMGKALGKKIKSNWQHLDIDVVIPIPETSCDIALQIAQILHCPYRQGFVKNRYIGRTFIMSGQQQRVQSVRRKLNTIPSEFVGKNVLLVDDSIVRGTTSKQIIDMAREAGAKKVYFASAAPEIRFPNVYGIDMPCVKELIAHGREVNQIAQYIGADGLIFQDLSDLIQAVSYDNPQLKYFDTSVFDGHYITGDIDQDYLDHLTKLRTVDEKNQRLQVHEEYHLTLFNE